MAKWKKVNESRYCLDVSVNTIIGDKIFCELEVYQETKGWYYVIYYESDNSACGYYDVSNITYKTLQKAQAAAIRNLHKKMKNAVRNFTKAMQELK